MKHFRIGSGAITLVLFAVAFAAPVRANNGGFVKSNQLDDGSKFFQGRREYQLINVDPVLRDCRNATKTKVYKFNIPPAPVDETEVVQVGAPASGGTVGGQSFSGPSWQKSDLPVAGFESNVPRGGSSIAKNLPSGSSSNSGIAKLLARPTAPAAVASKAVIHQPTASRVPAVLTYPAGSGASVASNIQGTGTLHGALLNQNKKR